MTSCPPHETAVEKKQDFRKLDIGCGPNKRPGHYGIDRLDYPCVDKVWDVGEDGLRFLQDGCVDCVYASHLLEHVPFVPMLREIHRVLKVGGTAEIYVPHGSSVAGYADPTHIRPGYAFRTWDYVESGAYDLPAFRIVWRRLYFKPRGHHEWFTWVINHFPRFFERHLANAMGGCHEVGALMEKVDDLPLSTREGRIEVRH